MVIFPSFSTFEAYPSTPAIGADIVGIDITRPLTQVQVRELAQALAYHQVLFFRDQHFECESQMAFARNFGSLHMHPTGPSRECPAEVLRLHTDGQSRMASGEEWHSDVTCDVRPPMGSILYLHTVPESGGDTLFASMCEAYDALSGHLKSFLEGVTATHDGSRGFRPRYSNSGQDDNRQYPSYSHPVVRTHPVSGRKAIFVNPGFTTHIDGLPRAESDAILAFLYAHAQKPEFQVRFRWRPHSVAFWDNRCTQHRAIWDYFPEVRSGYRVTIQGDRPF